LRTYLSAKSKEVPFQITDRTVKIRSASTLYKYLRGFGLILHVSRDLAMNLTCLDYFSQS